MENFNGIGWKCLNWINLKLRGLNWIKVKLEDWNEFQLILKCSICILSYFLIYVKKNYSKFTIM